MSLNQWSPNYDPLRFFIRPAELFLKAYLKTSFWIELYREHPSFRFLPCSFHWRTHQDFRRKIAKLEHFFKDHYNFGRKNSKIRDRFEVKTFFLALARGGPRNLNPAPGSKSLGTTALNDQLNVFLTSSSFLWPKLSCNDFFRVLLFCDSKPLQS